MAGEGGAGGDGDGDERRERERRGISKRLRRGVRESGGKGRV
jgi:hypothetical protein